MGGAWSTQSCKRYGVGEVWFEAMRDGGLCHLAKALEPEWQCGAKTANHRDLSTFTNGLLRRRTLGNSPTHTCHRNQCLMLFGPVRRLPYSSHELLHYPP
jgi:hypothetical protein